jgi:hypothetical protein
MPPNSTYKIAPTNNRLQKNMYGGGYSEVMDYGAVDAFPEQVSEVGKIEQGLTTELLEVDLGSGASPARGYDGDRWW